MQRFSTLFLFSVAGPESIKLLSMCPFQCYSFLLVETVTTNASHLLLEVGIIRQLIVSVGCLLAT